MTATLTKIQEDLDRFRRLRAEATDPLAARLLQDIIEELEISLAPAQELEGRKPEGG